MKKLVQKLAGSWSAKKTPRKIYVIFIPVFLWIYFFSEMNLKNLVKNWHFSEKKKLNWNSFSCTITCFPRFLVNFTFFYLFRKNPVKLQVFTLYVENLTNKICKITVFTVYMIMSFYFQTRMRAIFKIKKTQSYSNICLIKLTSHDIISITIIRQKMS